MSKILIVDDDVAIAHLISDALEDEGFNTAIAFDGISAYNFAQQNAQDIALITLDIMMPEISGIELCRNIRSTVSCPIIFVSAKSNVADKITGLEFADD